MANPRRRIRACSAHVNDRRDPAVAVYYSPGDGLELLPEMQRVCREVPEVRILICADGYTDESARLLAPFAHYITDRKRLRAGDFANILLGGLTPAVWAARDAADVAARPTLH